jgi:hypothetical protein
MIEFAEAIHHSVGTSARSKGSPKSRLPLKISTMRSTGNAEEESLDRAIKEAATAVKAGLATWLKIRSRKFPLADEIARVNQK